MGAFVAHGVTAARIAALRSNAQAARDRNYSPYSGFMVLAAVETPVGTFGGSNVENVNYTLTKHAEEVATLAAIQAGAGPEGAWIETLYVTSGPPCGSCRQFVAEFGGPETVVLIDRIEQEEVLTAELAELSDATIEAWRLGDLLPAAFGPEDLGGVAHA
jgi:cytidine deaminase